MKQINKIINLGTEGLSPTERPAIRLINMLCLIIILGASIGELTTLVIVGFDIAVFLNVAALIFFCLIPVYFNAKRKYNASKWTLVVFCYFGIISNHFSVNYEVGSYVTILCIFPLFVALFNSNKAIFIFSLSSLAIVLFTIYLSSLPSHQPLGSYFGRDLLVMKILYVTLSVVMIFFFSYFMKSTLYKQQKLLNKALDEKDVLLKEVHHRVKNNLQVISSLFNLQQRRIDPSNHEMLELIEAGQGRIQSMALVHQQLYEQPNLKVVQVDAYVKNLIRHLEAIYNTENLDVTYEIDIEEVTLPLEKVIALGLIINEVMSNIYKHAFPGASSGKVKITLQNDKEGKFCLVMKDNGVGLPEKQAIKQKGIGIQLIEDMVIQLGGTHELINEQGVTHKIIF